MRNGYAFSTVAIRITARSPCSRRKYDQSHSYGHSRCVVFFHGGGGGGLLYTVPYRTLYHVPTLPPSHRASRTRERAASLRPYNRYCKRESIVSRYCPPSIVARIVGEKANIRRILLPRRCTYVNTYGEISDKSGSSSIESRRQNKKKQGAIEVSRFHRFNWQQQRRQLLYRVTPLVQVSVFSYQRERAVAGDASSLAQPRTQILRDTESAEYCKQFA